MWTRALASADASCGGKAHGLARLIAAGLRVPDGFVIDDRAFRVATGDAVRQVIETGQRSPGSIAAMHQAARSGPIDQHAIEQAAIEVGAVIEPDPGISLQLQQAGADQIGHTLETLARQIWTAELPLDLVDEVTTRARRLGGPFAVRSSATIEDSDAGAAAGVFSSRTAVPRDELWSAIRGVWVSALTPLAAAYARRRGGSIAISVIVQRYADGERITIYTRPPGAPDGTEVLVQREARLVRLPRAPAEQIDPTTLGFAAERAIAADRGADVELIVPRLPHAATEPARHPRAVVTEPAAAELTDLDVAHAWFVQARPIIHSVVQPRPAPPPIVLVPLQDGQRWTLDVAHNPDPLSIAQTDLVARVEHATAAPWSARVVAGYLYTTGGAPRPPAPASVDELRARAAAIEARLVRALDVSSPPTGFELAAVIERYLAFYRIWAHELGPLIAASRGDEPAAIGDRHDATEAWLLAAARGAIADESVTDLLGVLSPAWDVACATFGERMWLVRDAIARARATTASPARASTTDLLDPPDPTTATTAYFAFRDQLATRRSHEATTIAGLAADLAERDDFYFAVAQWTVRRAILQRADELGITREDACWIPLDDLIEGNLDPVDVGRRASGARAAATRAATWNMPIVVGDSSTRNSGVALHGLGSGQVVTGRVRRFESLASAIVVGHGDIVVTRAVTPALAVIVIGCAAIISETGGLLDHGAAMARELGIPCIVGCRDAWTQLADGMIVTIDHDVVSISH